MALRQIWQILTWPLRVVAAPFVWVRNRFKTIHHFFTEIPEEASLDDTLGAALDRPATLMDLWAGIIEHLEVLRQHLFRAFVVLALTTVGSFAFADKLMIVLAVPLGQTDPLQIYQVFQLPLVEGWQLYEAIGNAGLSQLQAIEPTETVGIFMRVSLIAGFVFAMPWIVLELYLFIAPGLMPRTRLQLLIIIPTVSVLFLLGVAFTYFVMLPAAVPFLANFMQIRAAWRPAKYFELVTSLMFWIGLAFQMPLIIYTLASMGFIRTRQLVDQWRVAIVVMAVLSAIITPTTDPVNMGLALAPMILLYGFSIVGAAIAEAGRKKQAQAQPQV